MGFEINAYDMLVANTTINGKRCTIIWYVDDIKVSHEDESVVKDIMNKIESKFGKLNTNLEKEQEYLGMSIKSNDDKVVSIHMKGYTKEVISKFDSVSHITSATSTPALPNLFVVDTMSPRLEKVRSELYHHCVAKLLYVFKRCRLDILTSKLLVY